MNTSARTWLITGISRGLGRALAQAVLARGDSVVGTTRSGTCDLPPSPRLHVLPLDLADPEQIHPAMQRARELCPRFDVVVNNAAYGLLGAVEECATPEAYELFFTNFFGAYHLLQELLPDLRVQRRGHILNISSIAAVAPQAGSGLYAASKAALEALSESLAAELAPLGVRLTIIEPGAFRTDFLSPRSLQRAARSIGDYAASSGQVLQRMRRMDGVQLGDPELAAQAILAVVDSPEPPLRLLLGSDALQRARLKLARQCADIDRWEDLTVGTDHTETVAV
jgi:NAD(P)-dependent dehydrogenase (short-subunit alcohol dehydrogenase family)